MKILFYNICFSRGVEGKITEYLKFPFLLINQHDTNEKDIGAFLEEVAPDIACLVEVDKQHIDEFKRDGGFHYALHGNRYGKTSRLRNLPLAKNHHYCILLKNAHKKYDEFFFTEGVKKAAAIVSLGENLTLIMVHLALFSRARKKQIAELTTMVQKIPGELILCGDFNTFEGIEALRDLAETRGLRILNKKPTCPTAWPRYCLDHFLVSSEITVKKFDVLENVRFSDHLPVVLEIEPVTTRAFSAPV